MINVAGSGRTIAAHVAHAKENVLVNDLFADDRFPEGTGWGDPTLTSVICVPVVTLHDECSAVIELYRDTGVVYVQVRFDVGLIEERTRFIGFFIHYST